MRLVHFSKTPLESLRLVPQEIHRPGDFAPKPTGLWVSDEDAEMSWLEWCVNEMPGRLNGSNPYEVTLSDKANLLLIHDASGIDDMTAEFGFQALDPDASVGQAVVSRYWINWPRIAAKYQGIIITPYIESRRLSDAGWYYPWDCASGCIWDPAAVALIRTLDPSEIGRK